jgi:hypothetical protein
LRVLENRVLRRIFGPTRERKKREKKGEGRRENGENYVMKSFTTY